MSGKRDHSVELHRKGFRWVASELSGKITIKRDGGVLGTATWRDDQLVDSTTTAIPDDVVIELEKVLKERIDKNWEED